MNRHIFPKKRQDMVVVGLYMALVALGWWLPNDLLDNTPNLKIFTDFMASIVPQIDRVTTLGGAAAGNANRALYALLWVPSTLLGVIGLGAIAVVIYRWRELNPDEVSPLPIWKQIAYLLAAIPLTYESLFWTFLRPESRLVEFSLINRFGAGLWAPLLSIAPVLFAGGGVTLFILLIIRAIRFSSNRNQ